MSTSKDPVRMVLDPSCPESQRQLLRHGTGIAPPRDAEARVWQALVGAIGAGVAAGSADASTKVTTTATKAQVAGLSTAKIVAVTFTLAALTALVALGGYLIVSPKGPPPGGSVAPSPVAEVPAMAAAPPPAAAAMPPLDQAPPAADTAPARLAPGARSPAGPRPRHGVAAGPSPTAPSAASRLREETTFVREARQALRAGDATRALRLLAECGRLFPAGVLEQERERLTIEALFKDGRASEASARAAAFLRKYPDSPHAGEIRALGVGASGSR